MTNRKAARAPASGKATPRKVAYLGPAGTFSEIAARKLFPKAEAIAMPSVADIGNALAQSKTLCAALAFQNSDAGFIGDTVRVLTRGLPLFVTGLYDLQIRFGLYRLEGDTSHLTQVFSHPAGLKQCEEWIRTHNVKPISTNSTSEGPRRIRADHLTGVGAIAASGQSALFNLPEAETNLQGPKPNKTRFVRLERQPSDAALVKTIFAVAEGPSGLAALLRSKLWAQVKSAEIASLKVANSIGAFSYVVHGQLGEAMAAKALRKGTLGARARLIGWFG